MNSDSNDTEVVWNLLRKHVPEVANGLVRILGMVREPGNRLVMAVASSNPLIDPVGTCVGLRGGRMKEILNELGGKEIIDVVRWDESPKQFIANLLAPLRLTGSTFDEAGLEAKVRTEKPNESGTPGLTLKSQLLMELTGWKLRFE